MAVAHMGAACGQGHMGAQGETGLEETVRSGKQASACALPGRGAAMGSLPGAGAVRTYPELPVCGRTPAVPACCLAGRQPVRGSGCERHPGRGQHAPEQEEIELVLLGQRGSGRGVPGFGPKGLQAVAHLGSVWCRPVQGREQMAHVATGCAGNAGQDPTQGGCSGMPGMAAVGIGRPVDAHRGAERTGIIGGHGKSKQFGLQGGRRVPRRGQSKACRLRVRACQEVLQHKGGRAGIELPFPGLKEHVAGKQGILGMKHAVLPRPVKDNVQLAVPCLFIGAHA